MTNKNQVEEERTYMIKLPADSSEFVKTVRKQQGVTAINPYLSHNRFYQYIEIKKKDKRTVEREESLLTEILLESPVRGSRFCFDRKGKSGGLNQILNLLNERNNTIASRFFRKRRLYIFRPNDKLICGIGGCSPYSNIQLLRMHHVFGIPYIPASVIKGSVRSYFILEDFNGDEEKAEKTQGFKELFGTKADGIQTEGKLIFLDSFPEYFTMGFDVQTPHFKNYYEGKRQNPLDDEHPVPLLFTCLQDTKFQIYIACSDDEVWEKYEGEIDRAVKGVFKDYGIGAKTSLGYGAGKIDVE